MPGCDALLAERLGAERAIERWGVPGVNPLVLRQRDSGTASRSGHRRAPSPRLPGSNPPRRTAHQMHCLTRWRRSACRCQPAARRVSWRPFRSPALPAPSTACGWRWCRCWARRRRPPPAPSSPSAPRQGPLARPAIACACAASAATCPSGVARSFPEPCRLRSQ